MQLRGDLVEEPIHLPPLLLPPNLTPHLLPLLLASENALDFAHGLGGEVERRVGLGLGMASAGGCGCEESIPRLQKHVQSAIG